MKLKFLWSQIVAEMAAIGFGLPQTAFTSLMKQVPIHVHRHHIDWFTETFVPGSTIYMCFLMKLMMVVLLSM